MFNKIKNFVKKYKVYILITFVFVFFFVLILMSLTSKEEIGDEDKIAFDPERRTAEEIPTGGRNYDYPNYQIDMGGELVENLNKYDGIYRNYKISVIDHFEWADNFAKAMREKEFTYEKDSMPAIPDSPQHYLDQTLHYWLADDGNVFYDVQSDLLSFSFETPTTLSGVQISARDEASAKKSIEDISKKFFPKDFEYRVNEVSREGNYYRVDFSRMLNGQPLYLYAKELYLLVTPDGRLKAGRFLLAEFREDRQVSLISGNELREKINTLDHSKSIVLTPVDPRLYEEYGRNFFILSITGEENANINLEVGEVVYYYTVKFQEEVVPRFRLIGSGDIDIEGDIIDVDFEILTDAIAEKL